MKITIRAIRVFHLLVVLLASLPMHALHYVGYLGFCLPAAMGAYGTSQVLKDPRAFVASVERFFRSMKAAQRAELLEMLFSNKQASKFPDLTLLSNFCRSFKGYEQMAIMGSTGAVVVGGTTALLSLPVLISNACDW